MTTRLNRLRPLMHRLRDRFDRTVRPHAHVRRKFAAIYASDEWTNGSGPGSNETLTGEYRAFVQQFLGERRIRSVVDLGCGDWQFSRLIDWAGIEYVGYDVVPAVIEQNIRRHASGTIRFVCTDIRRVPRVRADLVIVKDVLQHLSNASVARILRRLRAARYLLATNDIVESAEGMNADTVDGGYRPVRLDYAPFNLPGAKVLEFPSVPHRKMTLLHEQQS